MPLIGILDLKWDKFLKYRVDPAFYNTDLGVIFNLDSWNALSAESQKLIQDVVIEWEAKSYADRQADIMTDAEKLSAGGMEFVAMSDAAAAEYLKMADDAAWARMKGRLDELGDSATYDNLRALYHP